MNTNQLKLFKLASRQGGYFTLPQAEACGIHKDNSRYYVKKNHWKKIERGIYQLSSIEQTDRNDFYIYWLWSQNKKGHIEGVISHESALILWDLSDILVGKIHLSVPQNFKRSAQKPAKVYLHRSTIQESDICEIEGLRVTSIERTIFDLLEDNRLSFEHIGVAYSEARRQGSLSEDAKDRLIDHFSGEKKKMLEDWEAQLYDD